MIGIKLPTSADAVCFLWSLKAPLPFHCVWVLQYLEFRSLYYSREDMKPIIEALILDHFDCYGRYPLVLNHVK